MCVVCCIPVVGLQVYVCMRAVYTPGGFDSGVCTLVWYALYALGGSSEVCGMVCSVSYGVWYTRTCGYIKLAVYKYSGCWIYIYMLRTIP